MANFLKPFVNWVAKHYGDNAGKMLIHTGVVGWILSSAAQVVAILINDKIPKKQKMYMIPQEIADAGVNILSFYLITQTFRGLTSKLVNTGRLLPKGVRNFLVKNNIADVGKKSFDVLKNGKLTPELVESFTNFKNGMDVVATTVGSVLSCNIVTPIVRNEIAANRQKKSIEKMEKITNQPLTQHSVVSVPYFSRPTMETNQNQAKEIDEKKKEMKMDFEEEMKEIKKEIQEEKKEIRKEIKERNKEFEKYDSVLKQYSKKQFIDCNDIIINDNVNENLIPMIEEHEIIKKNFTLNNAFEDNHCKDMMNNWK